LPWTKSHATWAATGPISTASLARQEVSMPQSPPVTIFNVNPLSIQVAVNNGPRFSVSGASPPNWSPQTSTSGGPGWSYNAPTQNVLAPGANVLTITPAGADQSTNLAVTLPRTFQWSSVQLYVFFDSYGTVNWVVLNDGQYVTGNLS
jgi:hypothetical protein